MAESALSKLYFYVGLVDRLTAPTAGMSKRCQKELERLKLGFDGINKGVLSIGGAFAGLNAFTNPARDFQKAINETASLGVAQEELNLLSKSAKSFSMQYGMNASEIVRASYDIQSAIPGLGKGALAAFTTQGALLAKATKATTGTITAYMGTMFNIFESDAERIGQAKWVELLAGKTSFVVQKFKTTGDNMSAAFTNLGSNAKLAGVSMDEQMAVLGQLQGTMGGANAGTAYAGFLNKTADAAQKLGLKFTDSGGRLLPTVSILEKIKGKFADINGDLTDAKKARIMSAFGEVGGKAVLNLLNKTGQLKGSIEELQRISSAGYALKMAQKMTDPQEKFNAMLNVIQIGIGQKLLPILNTAFEYMVKLGIQFDSWMEAFPAFGYLVGALAGAFSFLSISFGAFYALSGIKNMIYFVGMKFKDAYSAVIKYSSAIGKSTFIHKIATGWTWLYNHALSGSAIKTNTLAVKTFLLDKMLYLLTLRTKAATFGQWLWNGAIAAGKGFSGALAGSTVVLAAQFLWLKGCALLSSAATWVLNGGFIALGTSLWGVVTALWATGIPEIILLVLALIGTIGAVIYYWDEWTAAVAHFANILWGGLLSGFKWLMNIADAVKSKLGTFSALIYAIPLFGQILLIRDLINTVTDLWNTSDGFWNFFCSLFSKGWDFIAAPFLYIGELLAALWDKITGFFTGIPSLLSGLLGSVGGGLSKLWSWIPGLGGNESQTAASPPVVPAVQAVRSAPSPGIPPRNTATHNSKNYGGVTINTRTFPTPGQLEEWSLLNG